VAGFRLRVKLPPALKLRRTAGAFGEGGRRTAIALATAVSGACSSAWRRTVPMISQC